MKVPKLRLSRKLVLIIGGVLVLCGGTGAAAVYIGTDALLGPSYGELNGLSCIEVQTVEIHKKNRFWIRKYITTEEPGDGVARVKTALRIAKTVQAEKKADLVQVVVLDTNGPTARGKMRGRAVGADVIFMPDPSRVPEASSARILTARYADGLAAANGDFFGQRVDMTESDIQALVARLDDSTDCVTPEIVLPEGAEGSHGAPAAGHGEKPAAEHGEKPAEGHGEAPAEGHGEAPADAHGEAPAGEHGAETPVAEHGTEESKGWMASLMGMVGLGGDEAPVDAAHGAAEADGTPAAHGAADTGHAEAPAEGHGDAASAGEGHAAPADDAAADANGGAAHAPISDTATAAAHDAPADADASHEAQTGDQHGEAPAPAETGDAAHAAVAPVDGGHADGSADGEHSAAASDHAPQARAADMPLDAAAAEEDAPAPEAATHDATSPDAAAHDLASTDAPAENGGWLSSLKSMVGLGGGAQSGDPAVEGEPAAPADAAAEPAGQSADHGAAWLEKMRAQPIKPAADSAAPAAAPEAHGAATDHTPPAGEAPVAHAAEGAVPPAEDETLLPPKKVLPGEEAKAGH